jgi:hypothetical protein
VLVHTVESSPTSYTFDGFASFSVNPNLGAIFLYSESNFDLSAIIAANPQSHIRHMDFHLSLNNPTRLIAYWFLVPFNDIYALYQHSLL